MSDKIVFGEDKYVGGKLVYVKGVAYDLPEGSIDRWIKRGGVIVPGEPEVLPKPKVESPLSATKASDIAAVAPKPSGGPKPRSKTSKK